MQVRAEYVCPEGHDRKHYAFVNDNVYCEECKADRDLGHKKYK